MPTISNIAEAVLYVSDLAPARRFYESVLGLPVTLAFDDACFLQTGPDSTLILFDLEKLAHRVSAIPAHGARGQGHVALAVPPAELDAWRAHLAAQGVRVEHEQTWPQGTRSIYFRDPDENSVELIESSHYPQIWRRISPSNNET